MAMLNPFTGSMYELTTLTAAINLLPNRYGRLNEMGLFPMRGITTRTLMTEERTGVLTLMPTKPWGSPGTPSKSGSRKERSFVIPHIPVEDSVLSTDVYGIRAFGTENSTETVATLINDRLQTIRNKLDQTLEFMRMGALKGLIVDGAGVTLYDLYAELNVNKKSVDFDLDTSTTDVRAKCMEVVRHVEDNLFGERMTNIHALVSAEFFDLLVNHPNVQKAYANYQEASQRLAMDMRKGFTFGSITFEEYRATTVNALGASTRYIASGYGHCIPVGTMESMMTVAAPADFIETVNTVGQQYYARQEPMKFNRGMELHVQMNVLPLCLRPAIMVEIRT